MIKAINISCPIKLHKGATNFSPIQNKKSIVVPHYKKFFFLVNIMYNLIWFNCSFHNYQLIHYWILSISHDFFKLFFFIAVFLYFTSHLLSLIYLFFLLLSNNRIKTKKKYTCFEFYYNKWCFWTQIICKTQKTESNQASKKKVKTVKGPIKYTKDHHSKFDTRVVIFF